ncbi:MAG TPA: hypothetical protein DEG42_07765 [Acholeplasmataceae bacterium]|nr:hypothetical protein [Acholeplasmataceae bacterium]
MPRLNRASSVTVGNKELIVEDLLKTIIYLPAPQVQNFFDEIGLTIPREIRMYVLREVLREKVIETRKSRLTLADEINYRLSWYTEFTETQLENLLVFFDDPKIDKEFLEDFWTDLLSYMVEKKVAPKDLKRLMDMSLTHVRAVGLQLPDMKTYNRDLKSLFFDAPGKIDGLTPSKFRPVLYKSSTLTEIRDLGTKYEVEVPRRLKKAELANIIIQELKDRNKYSENEETKIRGMNVLMMQRYAIDHDIKASTELKKEEIIEYILANAKETKESYFIPESPQVYEKEVHEVVADVNPPKLAKKEPAVVKAPEVVQEEPKPEPAPEPIVIQEVPEEKVVEQTPEPVVEKKVEEKKVEEKVEEIKEKAVIKEPIKEISTHVEEDKRIQYVQQNIDISELVYEIKKLREAIELAIVPKENTAVQVQEEKKPAIIDAVPLKTKADQKAVVLNSAEFYGDPKTLKRIVEDDEANEREKLVESQKATSSIGTGTQKSKMDLADAPAEVRFFAKMFKGIGLFLFKFLKFILKYVLIIAAIAAVIVILYAVLVYFVTTLTFLQGVTDFFNNLGGFGIITRIHGILASLGI